MSEKRPYPQGDQSDASAAGATPYRPPYGSGSRVVRCPVCRANVNSHAGIIDKHDAHFTIDDCPGSGQPVPANPPSGVIDSGIGGFIESVENGPYSATPDEG